MTPQELETAAVRFHKQFEEVREEIGRVIVGSRHVVEGVLTALLAGGHALLEGVPGLGKTLLVRTLSQTLSIPFSRIQFTPDLMPADISGTNILAELPGGGREFRFQPGPVFAGIVLADEINRATPKTQSAMLEAMQEHAVTVSGTRYELPKPFFVLATQNPIEMEGTYPLPEAQLDRFLLKLLVPPPTLEELDTILDRTTGTETPMPGTVLNAQEILQMQAVARAVPIARHVREFAARTVLATQPTDPTSPAEVQRYARFGSSPRGAQALVLASKVRALSQGRYNVSMEDIAVTAPAALRHRVLLNFEAEAEGITTDSLVLSALSTAERTTQQPSKTRQ